MPKAPKKITVKLSEKDWMDLCNFVNGDLDNMPDGDEIKTQMREICDTIKKSVILNQ